MKNLKHLVLLFSITLFLISCNSDDEVQVNSKDLLGTWNLTEFTIDGTVSTVIENIEIGAIKFSTVGKDFDAQITFTENPNQFTTDGSFTAVTTTKILGQETVEEDEVDLDDLLDTGNWVLSGGNTLTFENNAEELQTLEIVDANSSMLKLTSTVENEATIDGTTTKVTTITHLTLTK